MVQTSYSEMNAVTLTQSEKAVVVLTERLAHSVRVLASARLSSSVHTDLIGIVVGVLLVTRSVQGLNVLNSLLVTVLPALLHNLTVRSLLLCFGEPCSSCFLALEQIAVRLAHLLLHGSMLQLNLGVLNFLRSEERSLVRVGTVLAGTAAAASATAAGAGPRLLGLGAAALALFNLLDVLLLLMGLAGITLA